MPHMDPHACTARTPDTLYDVYQAVLTYTCIDGFTVRGVNGDSYTIECLGTGMWATPGARCGGKSLHCLNVDI